MAFSLSSTMVRKSLGAHTWLGLLSGAVMYLICLSGALLVFTAELERWEQPAVAEFSDYDLAAAETAFNDAVLDPDFVTEHMYLILPSEENPRLRVASETGSFFLNADGSRGQTERNAFTEMLVKLHLYLHLPESWGIVLVSALGALLVALILSGILAHPKIFRDAFAFRLGGNRLLTETDLHNRLSVWGLPFHLLIAVTGAYFGLALVNLGVVAELIYDGDRASVVDAVFTPDPTPDSPGGAINLVDSLAWLEQHEPQVSPQMIVLHDAGQPGQHQSISATHPGRLIYGENYRFDANGNFLQSDGYAEGPAGKQVLYSIYQLHFGWFAGIWGKLAYAVLGIALAVVSVTGINTWLARRGEATALNDVWVGIVWGTPLAITAAALSGVIFGWSPTFTLWLVLLGATLATAVWQNTAHSRARLQSLLVLTLLGLVAGHAVRFGASAWQGMGLAGNCILIATAGAFAGWLYRTRDPSTSSAEPLSAPG